MRVLMAASEAVPFAKTGGLADVIGSLPKALRGEGCDVRVIMPKYGTIAEEYKQQMQFVTSITVDVSWRKQYCGIEQMDYGGIRFYFIDNQYYFYRERIYGFFDEAERYAFFCFAVLAAIPQLDFQPDIIHCHDWQTALISVFLHTKYKHHADYQRMKTILTIHNLQFQGMFDARISGDILGLEEGPGDADRVYFNGDVNYLKGGIVSANVVTTVSETYAEEITHAYYGERLDGILRALGKIRGIANGIDYEEYNPMTDKAIPFNYENSLEMKKKNKRALQERLHLPVDEDIPLLAIVSRLTPQKGLDLIACVLDEVLQERLQLVILGSGEARYEKMLTEAANRHKKKMVVKIRFDERLARLIYAGSDMFLMPSHFEPCGLSQLIALRYGSIPIVRATGGLKDTVQPYNEHSQEGNGFAFTNYNAHEMLHVIRHALNFYQDPVVWKQIIGNAIKSDNSWHKTAGDYLKIYGEIAEQEV